MYLLFQQVDVWDFNVDNIGSLLKMILRCSLSLHRQILRSQSIVIQLLNPWQFMSIEIHNCRLVEWFSQAVWVIVFRAKRCEIDFIGLFFLALPHAICFYVTDVLPRMGPDLLYWVPEIAVLFLGGLGVGGSAATVSVYNPQYVVVVELASYVVQLSWLSYALHPIQLLASFREWHDMIVKPHAFGAAVGLKGWLQLHICRVGHL